MNAHGNPDEIRALASAIANAQDQARTILSLARDRLGGVDWIDDSQRRYAAEHEAAFHAAIGALANLEPLPGRLSSIADHLEGYLQH